MCFYRKHEDFLTKTYGCKNNTMTINAKKLNPTESNPVAQETCNVFIRLKSVFMHTQILKTDHILLQVLQMWIFDIIYLVRLNMKAVLNEIVPAFLHRHRNTSPNTKHQ